jgi:hypothetical protein
MKLKKILVAAAFAVALSSSAVAPPAAAQTPTCNLACEAFQWAYPVWRNAWSRFVHSAHLSATHAGGFAGTPSSTFAMNRIMKRVARIPATLTSPIPTSLPCGLSQNTPHNAVLPLCGGDPWRLNPSPVIAPDVDALESRGYLDLARAQILQIPDPTADPDGSRPYTVAFFDMYNNVTQVIDNTNFPNGGRFCLISGPSQQAICSAVPEITATFQLSRFGTVLARVGSESRAASCVDPASGATESGVDGCHTMDRIGLAPVGPLVAMLIPFAQYSPLMDPNSAAACAFHPGQAPCTNGNINAFWDTVCKVLAEAPVSPAEAAYIDSKFGALGIHSTGCSSLDYASLNAGLPAGYQSLASRQATTGKIGNLRSTEWINLPFNGTWNATAEGFLLRAQAALRLQFLLPGEKAAYWAAFTDSRPAGQRAALSGANGVVYRVQIPSEQNVPVYLAQGGSWSVSVYTPEWFTTTGDRPFGRHSITSGTPLSFHLAADCTGLNDCVRVPNGPFQLLFRGYQPQASLSGDGDYRLPKILPAIALAVRANDQTKTLNTPDPALTYQLTSGALAEGDQITGQLTRVAGESLGSYAIQQGSLALGPDYQFSFTPGTLRIVYAPAQVLAMGQPTRTALQPINPDGMSVFKQGSTVAVKFRVADANGVSIGTPGVVTDFRLIQVSSAPSTPINEVVEAKNGDTAFRWSAADQMWIFNIDTKPLQAGITYTYQVSLNDGTSFTIRFSLR